jgi:hypothetical protein
MDERGGVLRAKAGIEGNMPIFAGACQPHDDDLLEGKPPNDAP